MKFLPLIGTALSGSLGGVTASHNKGGAYFRQRSIPTNPNTARQQAVRAILGSLTQLWITTLSESQRQAWRDYASVVTVTNVIGQAHNLTGQQQFVRSNTPRVQAELAAVLDAPTQPDTGLPVESLTAFTKVSAAGDITISGNFGGEVDAGGHVLFYIGPRLSAGARFFKGPYQFAGMAAFDATDQDWVMALDPSEDDPVEWFSSTVPTDDDNGVPFGLRFRVTYADGRLSQDFAAIEPFVVTSP